MEPHAAIAEWDGDKLTVHASLQMLNYNITELADALELEEDNVRIVSRYVGGGFGSKLGVSEEMRRRLASPPCSWAGRCAS